MVELFGKGGPFMWPILAILIAGLVLIGERLYSLLSTQKWGESFASDVTNQLESAGALEAQTMCEQGKGPISNLLLTGLENLEKGPDSIEKVIDASKLVKSNILHGKLSEAVKLAEDPKSDLGKEISKLEKKEIMEAIKNLENKILKIKLTVDQK